MQTQIINIGSRRELFVDRYLVDELDSVSFKLHAPQPAPQTKKSRLSGDYMTVLKDGGSYRAYFRKYLKPYQPGGFERHPEETTRMAESADGINWTYPDLGLIEINGSLKNNVVLRNKRYCHNFAPFIDTNPNATPSTRYKALAGCHNIRHENFPDGLSALSSPDGINWHPLRDTAVITQKNFAFDSQNVSFWSEEESCYVCYFRTWETKHGPLRTISRTTSPDFINWTPAKAMEPNLPGENLYVSQTFPYFRAPHIYLATPTRFMADRVSSTDILFMSTRAGSSSYQRLFTEAFLRPGMETARWGNRANYLAWGMMPTSPKEISIYHSGGRRFTLRTDGFISLHAGSASGTVTTRPFIFNGSELSLNLSTSAAGSIRVEILDETGLPLPGHTMTDADEIFGDDLAFRATWRGDADLADLAGRPIRLRIAMRESDLFSLAFVAPFYGQASKALKPYHIAFAKAAVKMNRDNNNLTCIYRENLPCELQPAVEQARAAASGKPDIEARLQPIVDGFEVARLGVEALNHGIEFGANKLKHMLNKAELLVKKFDRLSVLQNGPALYPPLIADWQRFSAHVMEQGALLRQTFKNIRIESNLDHDWRFQTDAGNQGCAQGWMNPDFPDDAWPFLNAQTQWQEQGFADYKGAAWYRKTIQMPGALRKGRKLLLLFGAADGDAKVYLDGKLIGEHLLRENLAGWNEPFFFDITPAATNGKHLVAARVCKTIYSGGLHCGAKLLNVK